MGLDVDWITGHLYIADSGRGEILAFQGNGDLCTAVITHIGCLSTLVLDQKNRYVYELLTFLLGYIGKTLQ